MKNTLAALITIASTVYGRILPYREISFAALNITALQAQPIPYDPRFIPSASSSTSSSSSSSSPYPYFGTTWAIECSCCGYGAFTPEAVNQSSIVYQGLFDIPCGRSLEPSVAEWGYEYFHNQNNIFPVCGNLTTAGYSKPPVSREEALNRMNLYYACRTAQAQNSTTNGTDTSPVLSIPGHYLVNGVAGMNKDTGIVGTEIGENINSINAHYAFTRGSARQFHLPFSIDFSAWYDGYIRDYTQPGFWGTASSPVGGHSISLFKRSYFTTFMVGAGSLIAEAGCVNYFASNVTNTTTNAFPLSPIGELGKDLYQLTHANISAPTLVNSELVRGIPYIPIAFIVPVTMNFGLEYFYQSLDWGVFDFTPENIQVSNMLYTLWPSPSFTVENGINTPESEVYYMAGSMYGEIFDFLIDANISTVSIYTNDLFASYRMIAFPGFGVRIDSNPDNGTAVCDMLKLYVSNGGTLWISANDILNSPVCFDQIFTGITLAPNNATTWSIDTVLDITTGTDLHINSSTLQPVCTYENGTGSTAVYIKTGGDPNSNTWDGGINDKCCRKDSTDCYWFGPLASCQSVLPVMKDICLSCTTDNSTIGCPTWDALPPNTYVTTTVTIPVIVDQSSTVTSLFTGLQQSIVHTNQPAIPIILRNTYYQGQILISLSLEDSIMSSIDGFGVRAYFLGQIMNDTLPSVIGSIQSVWKSNNLRTTNNAPVIQYHLNRQPTGWNITLVNNYGIVKQPSTVETINSTMVVQVYLTVPQITIDVQPGDVSFVFVEDSNN